MENRSLTSRRFRKRKADYWPQIRQLVLEGQTCRQIAADLGLHKTTVNNWLQELRQEFREQVADPAEITAFAVARLDVIYGEAEIPTVVETSFGFS
jgi:FixJ family two-component response regulator